MLKTLSSLHRPFVRSIHLTAPSFTAGQTQYHGQPDSTWWEKYGSHVDPVQSRTDLLNMDDLDERHFRPVKPVIPTYQSYSCFHDPIVSRVIGLLLREGNRELVEELMHKTFRTIKLIQVGKWHRAKTDEERASIECNPVVLLKQAVKNATPIVRLTRIAKGGTLYSVPIPTSPTRGTYTAIRLLIDSTHDARPHDQRFWTLFAKEIMDAAQNQGRTIKKKQEIHRNAELNRAYAHFKWQNVYFKTQVQIKMSHIINKIFGRDDEAHAHHSSIKTETHTSAKNGGEGINIKSTISSDINSSVSMANQQKLNDLVTKLGSTHTQIDEYAKKQTAKINDEIQREIDQVLACTRIRQEELLKRANEHTNQIDAEYCAQLQRMVEEIDAAKAKRIAEIETELNGQQGEILQTARREIDQLNQKAANLKIGVLQEAQAQAASQADQITTQATNLGQATTAHNATGTTTIKTEVTAAATTKETGNAAATTAAHCSNRDGTCADGSCSKTTATHKEQCSAGGAKTLSETRTSETARHQSNTSKN